MESGHVHRVFQIVYPEGPFVILYYGFRYPKTLFSMAVGT